MILETALHGDRVSNWDARLICVCARAKDFRFPAEAYGVEASPAAERYALTTVERLQMQRHKIGARTVASDRRSLR
ncbi:MULTISPECIES: hypothetical protein [Burkholderia cepacia complex]|uniref:Uncharacterized protein n=1 Tax=Burkholderia ubonensis TaxID=101571 RepID=A0A1B4LK94_9BURK|nr:MULTISPECIES: hypothetical protein [Burkholderia cepacia complex]AOJ77576.1 hypothetical protein WJ35_20995 [Burkholderia ubonensis]AOK13161.1 hypothetical protein WK31_23375 [Burkholderia vietnamiensis]